MNRAEAIDMLRQIASYLTAGNPVWRTEPIREACEMAIEALTEKEASAERRGKWIDGQCSICGCDIPAYIIDWKWQKDMDAKYCPNCGAKMEGVAPFDHCYCSYGERRADDEA